MVPATSIRVCVVGESNGVGVMYVPKMPRLRGEVPRSGVTRRGARVESLGLYQGDAWFADRGPRARVKTR